MSKSIDSKLDIAMPDIESMPSGISAHESDTQVFEWNQTDRAYPLHLCLHQLFELQAARTPDAVAVVSEEKSITYSVLNARANRLAAHLRSLGVGPDFLTGVCMARSVEMIIVLLAILKAGGAYVPMDPHYPVERLHFILNDANLKVVLTHHGVDQILPEGDHQLVRTDEPVPGDEVENLPCLSAPDNLAYIIYTSGSTGKPKGVAIEHHNAVSFVCWARDEFSDEEFSGVLGATSICFDLSIFEIFGTLSWGGKIILVDSAVDLPASRHQHEVKLLNTVPSVMQTLLKADAMPSSVITINLAGEPLRPPLVDALYALGHVRRVNDLYGPSETTTYSTWTTRKPHQPATIGRPIANTQVYVLDLHLRPVPVGVSGELFIGGEGVARGYLNEPRRTAEKFLPDPFSGRRGARIYRTGDVVRYFPDGNLEYLGRADHQVKIRGYRVEPGEIEAVLGNHPGISACAVIARADSGGDKSLTAFVVPREGAELASHPLRDWLGSRLPEYMIPSRFFALKTMSLTPNGKIDRKAFENLDAVDLGAGAEIVPPRNELERELIGIWQSLLDRGRIGIRDNFFDLGGNSLLAAQLAAEIHHRWAHRLPVAAFFQSPVIEQLAERLTQDGWSPKWKSLVPLQTLGSKPPLFLVHGWGGDVFCFVDLARHLAPDQPVYGIQAVGLDGKEPKHSDIATMVAHYVDEIRAFHPQGPYYIGGYSLGGVFAFEVAQRLHRSGERVAMLALFDSDPVGLISWKILPYLAQRCTFHLGKVWKTPNRSRIAYCRKALADLRARMSFSRMKQVPEQIGFDRKSATDPGAEDYFHVLTLGHHLKPYPGSATVFVSDDSVPGHMSFWKHLVRGGISFHEIPGTHHEILARANVPRLIQSLNVELEKVRATLLCFVPTGIEEISRW